MARERIAVDGSLSGRAHKFSTKALETLGADRVITAKEVDDYNGFAFDPGGAGRNVTLPAESTSKGCVIMVSNEADNPEVLTIRNDTPATICTPGQNEAALLWCDGTNWYGLVGATS